MTATAIPSGPADALWKELSRFQVGNQDEHRDFLARLGKSQGWSALEASTAFQEYLRFIYLAATSHSERTPSQPVDEVWHLHLENAASYDRDLCQGVLRRALPHNVGERNEAARVKYREQYVETIAAYREAFKSEPPKDFWPEPGGIARRVNNSGWLLSIFSGLGLGVFVAPAWGFGSAVITGIFFGFVVAGVLSQIQMFSEEYVATRAASNGSCGSGCGGGSSGDSGGSGGGDGGGGGCGGGGGD